MTATALEVRGVSKQYRLGVINYGTLYRDLQSLWARLRGLPDPNMGVGEESPLFEPKPSTTKRPRPENFLALNNVSFDVHDGETFGIIGRNGAGKSTLLKILSRITAPSSGVVRIRGRIASLLEVGTGFHPELTGRENVFLNGAILGMTRTEVRQRLSDIVDFAQLSRFIDTPVKRYSSGMYVRLAFSVAAHLNADILIVDEVLAVGDSEFQKRCLGKMREISTAGRTVLLVSHNMTAIQNLCSRAVLLLRGQIIAEGDPAEVIKDYTEIRNAEATDERFSLAVRSDRGGNGAFRFVDASVVGARTDAPTCGGEITIGITIRNASNRALRDVNVAVGLDNYLGERITILATQAVGATLRTLPVGETKVEFRIPRVPFLPGTYFFTLFGTTEGIVADWVQSASSFQVDHGDFYGVGGTVPSGQGSIVIPYDVRSLTAGG